MYNHVTFRIGYIHAYSDNQLGCFESNIRPYGATHAWQLDMHSVGAGSFDIITGGGDGGSGCGLFYFSFEGFMIENGE